MTCELASASALTSYWSNVLIATIIWVWECAFGPKTPAVTVPMVSQTTWALRSRQKKKIQTSSLEFQKQTATLTQPWSSTLVPFVLRRDPSCFLHLFRSGKTSGWNGENFVKYMTSWLVKYMCFLVKSMTCEIHDLWNTWPGEVFERSCISQVMDFTDFFVKYMCFFVKYMTCEIHDLWNTWPPRT